jgi:hypothetical protein
MTGVMLRASEDRQAKLERSSPLNDPDQAGRTDGPSHTAQREPASPTSAGSEIVTAVRRRNEEPYHHRLCGTNGNLFWTNECYLMNPTP